MAIGSDPNVRGEAGSDPVEVSRAELVHEARKAIKRMRALARLLRYELGEQELKRVDSSLHAAGRRLAGARDADVRLATLEHLRTRHPKALAGDGIERLRERLEREREQADAPTGGWESEHDVLADIANMRRDLARWNHVEHDFGVLAPGLRRIYREGRRRYVRAKRAHGQTEEDIHDWRKRVKSLYYALDMLGGTKAKGAHRATKRADRLGEELGEEHDLWMLCVYVGEHPDVLAGDAAAQKKLLQLIERRRERLRGRALKLGARLYKRKPGKFTRRIGDALSN